jgi:hypothetical protein
MKHLDDWRGDLMTKLRAIVNKSDASLKEDRKWGTPVWTSNGNAVGIGAVKESVRVNFFKTGKPA